MKLETNNDKVEKVLNSENNNNESLISTNNAVNKPSKNKWMIFK
nr:hypothetical protein [Mycoplasmopsis bovis]